MIKQVKLGTTEPEQKMRIRQLVKSLNISFAGNKNLRIYGRLGCATGKRMKPANRVFFKNETEAIEQGYRPCGHCMREKYNAWTAQLNVRQR